jgi:hypothetical protein
MPSANHHSFSKHCAWVLLPLASMAWSRPLTRAVVLPRAISEPSRVELGSSVQQCRPCRRESQATSLSMKRLQRRRGQGVRPARWDVLKWKQFDRTFFVPGQVVVSCPCATRLKHSTISAENREARSLSFTVPRPCLFSSIPQYIALYIHSVTSFAACYGAVLA